MLDSNFEILKIHEGIYQYLLNLHNQNTSLLFTMRKTNRFNRLEKGYWFIGNDKYLQVSFWEGTDVFQKIYRIGFFVEKRKQGWVSNVYISCKDEPNLDKQFRTLAKELGGFVPRSNHLWKKAYSSFDYIENLYSFIENDKVIIDKFIANNTNIPVERIKHNNFTKNLDIVLNYRN